MDTSGSTSANDIAIARATGFSEFVIALRRTLGTTPIGWVLTAWFCWDRVPGRTIALWIIIFVAIWSSGVVMLRRVIVDGSRMDTHRYRIHWVAGLDGLAWGLIAWFLIGHDHTLDAVLMALLCGVTSVNAQVYGTYITAYYWQIGMMWSVSVLGLAHSVDRQDAIDYALGLSVFVALTLYYTRAISMRLIAGICLQHVNGSLAAQLRTALKKVELDAATDALTGHGNRRALDDVLKFQVAFRASTGQAFSVLMLDIDYFKPINDRHGHLVGDDVLRAFAERLREFLRARDFCARFGGEEFVVVLPETELADAMDVAERIRKGIEHGPLLDAPKLHVTVSIGVATMDCDQSIDDLLNAADAAVYRAKNDGRNRVRTLSMPIEEAGRMQA